MAGPGSTRARHGAPRAVLRPSRPVRVTIPRAGWHGQPAADFSFFFRACGPRAVKATRFRSLAGCGGAYPLSSLPMVAADRAIPLDPASDLW